MASAQLFIRRIPSDTTAKELKEFIESGISWVWRVRFGRKIRVGNIRVVIIIDKSLKTTEFHGMVTIEPDGIADRLIRRLHARHFKGRRVSVGRYHARTWRNDRRLDADINNKALRFRDQRVRDRRRKNLEVLDSATIKMKAYDLGRVLI